MSNPTQNVSTARPGLSVSREALLRKWLSNRPSGSADAANESIPRRKDLGPAPLSFEQQRIWFFHQLEPQSPLYHMPIAAELHGVLQPHALQRALDAVVARHEAFRTRFVGDDPMQVVDAPSPVPMSFVDLRELPAAQRKAEARRILEAEARRPFDLGRDLMIRAALVRIDAEEWMFMILMHHIVSDDWSWRVLCEEVATLYPALAAGTRVELPEVPVQYGDFTVWCREALLGKTLQDHLAYWRQELAGAPGVLELPADHPRPAIQTFHGASEWLKFSTALTAKLNAFSQRFNVTIFTTLLAAFETLVHRYTGQEDLLVGSPVAGRTRGNLENAIGLFVNLVALRNDLSGNPPFDELLRRVREKVFEALARQELPFEKLVEELRPRRTSSHSPLVQMMFALQDELMESLRLPGIAVTPIEVETGTAKFDLTFTIVRSATGLNCCAEYNTDLFDQGTIRRMLGHYERLLEGVVANPSQRLSDLPLVTEEENQQFIEWNRTAGEFPRDRCVHELFAAQAGQAPDAIAIEFAERQLTYRELNRQSNQLAHHLRRLGVGTETLVAICVERSIEMIVGLLGILKAGGAYVPLDPSYPAERLRFMLADSGTLLVLTQSNLRSRLNELQLPDVRLLEVDQLNLAGEREDNSAAEVSSGNLAYVIYTSGSTGRPKGVQIPHRAVVNVLHSMQREPGLTRKDTLLSITSISFDIAALEIFLPLITGANLVLAGTETISESARLTELITKSKATVMQATPSLWRFLVESGWTGNRRLKILCGGESLSRELADQLLSRGAAVWNLYGPTETTIWSTACKMEPGAEPVSIGRPIANTQVHILDSQLQPVPIGCPGGLYIGGEGLARGYLNRPDLTAEKFISDPFDHDALSPRLYKTGDIARFRADGRIECLGRADHQVKLRGHRIDPGEIESVLRQHRAVRDALVLMREDEPGQQRLAAYWICTNGLSPDNEELQQFLKGKLPDYMIPSAFVVLQKFPLTPNGKIDRNALPVPDHAMAPSAEPFAAPTTPAEQMLAEIWQEILAFERVGIHDNFFRIGGHSLLGMQMMSRVRKAFQADLSLRNIFEAPTIAELAKLLEQKQNQPAAGSIPKARTISRRQAKELLSRLDELSSAEVESLLEQVSPAQKNAV
jgi:amino acid adenylation domain-containing protein